MTRVGSASQYNGPFKTIKRGISVAFFSKPVAIVAVFAFGVLFAVAGLTKGGEGCDRDEARAVDVSPTPSDAPALSREATVLRPIEPHVCSVNSIEPELKALFDNL